MDWDLAWEQIVTLPLSDGHDTILVVVCHLTKMVLYIPTFHDIDVEDLACIFLSQVFVKHGTLTDIVSNRGKHFISQFWRSLCQLLGIKANLSTAYHPETDGQTEQVNQILEQYFWVYVNYQQDDWVNLLPLAEFTYNNMSHSATMVTPFFTNKGFHPNSKCPSNLLCQRLLTKLLQISRSYICTSTTRSLVPSNNMRSIPHWNAFRSPHSKLGTLSGWTCRTSEPHVLEEARPSLPWALSDHREGVIACILTWSVPSSVMNSPCLPCVTAETH